MNNDPNITPSEKLELINKLKEKMSNVNKVSAEIKKVTEERDNAIEERKKIEDEAKKLREEAEKEAAAIKKNIEAKKEALNKLRMEQNRLQAQSLEAEIPADIYQPVMADQLNVLVTIGSERISLENLLQRSQEFIDPNSNATYYQDTVTNLYYFINDDKTIETFTF